MPTVEVNPDELRRLTGRSDRDDDDLRSDLFGLGLEYEGATPAGGFELEFAPDRLDRLSVEGIARSLRYQYGEDRGAYLPNANDAEWVIEVDDVPPGRPRVTGAVVRGVDLDAPALDSLIQLQEKLHATMGRDRAKGAIGIHDLTMLRGRPGTDERTKSITYTGVDPTGDRFVPLESDREMTPQDVLTDHQIGSTYADLVAGMDRFPAIYDDIGLFSFPPVINGRRTEVTTESRDLFVELTGTDQWTIDRMCTIICYALDARGARLERVTVSYPEGEAAGSEPEGRTLDRPVLSTTSKTVTHDRIETVLGLDLDPESVVDLLERSGLGVEAADGDGSGRAYDVEIPPYRVDVRHPLDIVDDIGRAYGFNELEPRYPDVSTVGERTERSRLERATREALVGLGFEDLLNFHLIGEAENFERMNLGPDDDAVGGAHPPRIREPYSADYAIVRTWALPSLLMVLENNTHRVYPQDLAEIGLATAVDETEPTGVAERRTVAAVLARSDATYEDMKARLQTLCSAFGVDLATPPVDHPSFIDGRTAAVVLNGDESGVIGELHPAVLVEHDLEVPVAGVEFDLADLA